jgi:NADP-dependent aldehyde dehydrogenase
MAQDDPLAFGHQARAAFDWLGQDRTRRASMLDAIAGALEARRSEILNSTSNETALTVEELTPEFARMVGTLRMFAGVVREGSWVRAAVNAAVQSPQAAIGPNNDVRRMLVPLGAAAVFGASNFPLAYGVCGGDTASAFAAGCPVVVKEHPAHPKTGRLIHQIASGAVVALGGPALVLGYVRNEDPKDHAVARELVQNPVIEAVGFTGSYGGGMALHRIANEREGIVPVFAEMGSANTVFVSRNAVDRRGVAIADQLADSILARFGQQCTKPGLIFVRDLANAGHFVQRFVDRVNAAVGRDMLAPWVADAYRKRVSECVETGRVEVIARGSEQGGLRGGAAVLMRSRWEAWAYDETLHKEIFGPAAILINSGEHDEKEGLLGSTWDGNLASSWYVEDDDAKLKSRVRAARPSEMPLTGRIIVNGASTGVRVAHGMVHGGPQPSTNRPDTTAVGPLAIERWCRPVCYQNCPQDLLPPELQDTNPLGIMRIVNGEYTRAPLGPS